MFKSLQETPYANQTISLGGLRSKLWKLNQHWLSQETLLLNANAKNDL